MYRGPGFEEFNPVLGSMPGHKEICDEWDARQLKRRNSSGQTRIAFRPTISTTEEEPTFTDTSIDQTDGTLILSDSNSLHLDREQEQHCLDQVLVVFPQVQHDFVRKLVRERNPGPLSLRAESHATVTDLPGAIIAEIAEMESIPRQKDLKRKHSPTARDTRDTTIRWNKDVLKNETYYKEALILLTDEFTRIPTHFVNKTLREKGTVYHTFQVLSESENTYNSSPRKPYSRSRLGRVTLEKKYQRTAVERRDGHQYVSIVNEFQAARQQQHREEIRQKRQKADDEAEANNFTLHEQQGSLVDCECCFIETPINRVVSCENVKTHFFCHKCIETRAKGQIGALKHEMKCMDTSHPPCEAELSKEALAQALPIKISDKLAEIQQLAEIRAAGLEGLEQCPFCEYQAVCATIDVDTIFECLNPDCEKASCRKCREVSHVPRSCEEAKKDKGLSVRHAVEEARSEAMMRTCPRCKVKIVKSAGCNKMTCSNCRAVMCYVCKKDITGRNYEHFGSGLTACPIQDQSAENRHQQEADDAENAAIALAKARNADLNEEDVRIEAHLNRRPGRGRGTGRHQELHRPPAGFHPPGVPQLQEMNDGQGHLLFGQERAAPPMGEYAVRMDRVNQIVQDAQQQQNRFRRMLEDHQRQIYGMQPFHPAPGLHPLPDPPRPVHGVDPLFRQAHQYLRAYPAPIVNVAPAQPRWSPFNNGPGAAGMQNDIQRDLLLLQGHAVPNHPNNPKNPVQRNGNVFPAQFLPPGINNVLRHPPTWAREPNNIPNPRGNDIPETRPQ